MLKLIKEILYILPLKERLNTWPSEVELLHRLAGAGQDAGVTCKRRQLEVSACPNRHRSIERQR